MTNNSNPIQNALTIISGKWRTQIIWQLALAKTIRFNKLKSLLPGISDTMLSQTLSSFEQEDIIHRHDYQEMPPKVEYSLTKKGKELLPILHALIKFSEDNDQKSDEFYQILVNELAHSKLSPNDFESLISDPDLKERIANLLKK
ncbi:winged helix-turn-helix transcriptional regulator [Leuconostoc carnosum]|uniref:winged helix-turn-helix transcriptional regulator n=1 Tax=Leuconostoc carnosum TaxID=1252 RepID=UPI0002EFD3C4|nr:helix-turn-helix domain-containing protein [Leuconostoc carnosum]KAA8366474.1 helix-turn-helix transcriptional regulator [Leuconostoc carnosum]MBB6432803.1 DNA-binding HxlR family transcriptional regulator [Leuconostoc carnosum]WLC59823.1 helix-turn-helix transcriptional regulator [Leuconostoc carnosum]WLC97553.1 helix-turn-helix domain-containing protein [Leuconostoc carnosum]SPJ43468.1 Transcriptional regulator [Leuconostoc carnosum]